VRTIPCCRGGVCRTCNGNGFVGDRQAKLACPHCNGTKRCKAMLKRRLFVVTGDIAGYGSVSYKTQAYRPAQAILQAREHFRKELGRRTLWLENATAQPLPV